jgi:hypothetical protein
MNYIHKIMKLSDYEHEKIRRYIISTCDIKPTSVFHLNIPLKAVYIGLEEYLKIMNSRGFDNNFHFENTDIYVFIGGHKVPIIKVDLKNHFKVVLDLEKII